MAKIKATPTPVDSSALPSPRSRREELLDALLEHTTEVTHSRILGAYRASGTVQGAEQEFTKIIQEIVDET
jgi:RNase P/RNase MRP subunit POP5